MLFLDEPLDGLDANALMVIKELLKQTAAHCSRWIASRASPYLRDIIIRMTKLTLSVDERVVAGAKRHARARGTSVSRLVETMLRLVSMPAAGASESETQAPPPVLASLRGSLKRGSVDDYRRHLARKYR